MNSHHFRDLNQAVLTLIKAKKSCQIQAAPAQQDRESRIQLEHPRDPGQQACEWSVSECRIRFCQPRRIRVTRELQQVIDCALQWLRRCSSYGERRKNASMSRTLKMTPLQKRARSRSRRSQRRRRSASPKLRAQSSRRQRLQCCEADTTSRSGSASFPLRLSFLLQSRGPQLQGLLRLRQYCDAKGLMPYIVYSMGSLVYVPW